jgi:BCD family chlorophyll transporter-like MFS transporter
MPFALLILSGDTHGPIVVGHVSAALAFLLVGAGLHTVQTAGLALATDLAPEEARPRVVAFLYVMLLLGMVVSALVFGALLSDFSQIQLIQVVQGAAVITMVLNLIALWKQEARDPSRTALTAPQRSFRAAWRELSAAPGLKRLLIVVALGTAAFSMQDILLEPYGGEILNLSVGDTTTLTAILASGMLAGFALAARLLSRGSDPFRVAANGLLIGVLAFSAVIFAAPMDAAVLLRSGTLLIGFGSGLFSVGMLIAAMAMAEKAHGGMVIGCWGAAQATAAGAAIALGGAIRDGVAAIGTNGALGPAFTNASAAYSVVYHLEIALLFATLVAIGPLIRISYVARTQTQKKFGLVELPT